MSLIQTALGTYFYVKAGSLFDRRDFSGAGIAIQKAEKALGQKIEKPGLFEFSLRAALIYHALGKRDASLQALRRAIVGIETYSRLGALEKSYLLDYCDRFLADITESDHELTSRLSLDDYSRVDSRLLRQYPLTPPF